MTSGDALYHSNRIAAGYAFARPAVHPRIIDRVGEHLGLRAPVARALDIGCGAGRSTAALRTFARDVVGIDPAIAMLQHRHAVAPAAHFVVGRAEHLPFADAAFDLVTAAGSINYADREVTPVEIARVLAPDGTWVIYDFSAGRRFADNPRLERWYGEFELRYPDAPGYDMDVRRLPFQRGGLELVSLEEFSVPVPMTADEYLRYALSETRVELARSKGAREADIRQWVARTLESVFDQGAIDVVFDAYAAYVRRS